MNCIFLLVLSVRHILGVNLPGITFVSHVCIWQPLPQAGLCLDIDPCPNSDARISQIGRFGGSVGSFDNDSASYLPTSIRPNPVAPYSANGKLSVRCSH